MKLRTNVKLNLGLSILRRRPDGYHDLETLFVPYSGLGDELEIVPAGEFSVDVRMLPDLRPCPWDPMKDLTVKAYELLCADFGLSPVAIRLLKGAPVGAGLGGGSADGAFALRMLSDLFGLGLSDEALAGYAARLGSDCPFFIYNRPMLGEGRGEILTPFDVDLSGFEIRVVVPSGVSVSTREAYSGVTPRESSGPAGTTCRSLLPLREALARPVEEWRDCLLNDFEPSVFAAHPQLAGIKEDLYAQGAVYASMSGSGSAIFGLFE